VAKHVQQDLRHHNYALRSSRYGSELPSVEDAVDLWHYALCNLKSCMPETTTNDD